MKKNNERTAIQKIVRGLDTIGVIAGIVFVLFLGACKLASLVNEDSAAAWEFYTNNPYDDWNPNGECGEEPMVYGSFDVDNISIVKQLKAAKNMADCTRWDIFEDPTTIKYVGNIIRIAAYSKNGFEKTGYDPSLPIVIYCYEVIDTNTQESRYYETYAYPNLNIEDGVIYYTCDQYCSDYLGLMDVNNYVDWAFSSDSDEDVEFSDVKIYRQILDGHEVFKDELVRWVDSPYAAQD